MLHASERKREVLTRMLTLVRSSCSFLVKVTVEELRDPALSGGILCSPQSLNVTRHNCFLEGLVAAFTAVSCGQCTIMFAKLTQNTGYCAHTQMLISTAVMLTP